MNLDPRFCQLLVEFLGNPSAAVDLAVRVTNPKLAEDMTKFAMLVGGKPTSKQLYEFFQRNFPALPDITSETNPDDAFREIFRAIICQWLGIDYKPQQAKSSIILGE